MAAKFTKIPMFVLEPEEAREIADAVVEVAAQHNIVISAKWAAWSNLFGVAAAVYGPRIALVVMMKQASQPPRPVKTAPVTTADANNATLATVTDINTAGKMKYD